MQRRKQGVSVWGSEVAVLDRMVGEGFSKKVILERRERKGYMCWRGAELSRSWE